MPTPSCCWLLCRQMPVLTNLRLAARYTYVYAHHPAVGYVECKISLLGSTAQTGRLSPPGDYWLSGPDAMQAGAAGEDCLPVSAASERIRCPETIMSPVLHTANIPIKQYLGVCTGSWPWDGTYPHLQVLSCCLSRCASVRWPRLARDTYHMW